MKLRKGFLVPSPNDPTFNHVLAGNFNAIRTALNYFYVAGISVKIKPTKKGYHIKLVTASLPKSKTSTHKK